MNLWQVWPTPSDTKMKSLSVEGVAVVSGVADGKRNVVGGDLVAVLEGISSCVRDPSGVACCPTHARNLLT